MAPGSDVVVTTSGFSFTVSVKGWLAGDPTPLVAVKVIGNAPDWVGVPESTPVEVSKLTPFGKVPVSPSVGAGEPVALTVNEPLVPSVKVVLDAEVIAAGEVKVNLSLADLADVPPGVVTVTSTVPADPAGDVAVIEVAVTTTTLVAGSAPKSTAVAPVRWVPVMVTGVAVPAGPEVGADAGDRRCGHVGELIGRRCRRRASRGGDGDVDGAATGRRLGRDRRGRVGAHGRRRGSELDAGGLGQVGPGDGHRRSATGRARSGSHGGDRRRRLIGELVG